MEKKGYVIQRLGYEYNDETYYRPQDGGGNPVAIITDEVAAKKRFLELEIEAWRGEVIGNYGYDLRELAQNEIEFESALESMGLEGDGLWDFQVPKDATDDQVKRLIKSSKIRFHEIVEVKLEEYHEVSDDEIGPSESILDAQESLSKVKSGIFDSVNQFTNPKVTSMIIPDNVSIEDIKKVVEETNDDFLTIKEEMKKLRDEARSKVKNFFLKGMNKVFETYPEVKSVSWTQYTPYFNDGEECTFRAYTDDFYVNGVDNYGDTMYGYEDGDFDGEAILDRDELDYDWIDRKKVYKKPESRSVKIYEAISGFLSQLDSDDYKTMFGDHACVIVKKDEVTIEEYDHE